MQSFHLCTFVLIDQLHHLEDDENNENNENNENDQNNQNNQNNGDEEGRAHIHSDGYFVYNEERATFTLDYCYTVSRVRKLSGRLPEPTVLGT